MRQFSTEVEKNLTAGRKSDAISAFQKLFLQ